MPSRKDRLPARSPSCSSPVCWRGLSLPLDVCWTSWSLRATADARACSLFLICSITGGRWKPGSSRASNGAIRVGARFPKLLLGGISSLSYDFLTPCGEEDAVVCPGQRRALSEFLKALLFSLAWPPLAATPSGPSSCEASTSNVVTRVGYEPTLALLPRASQAHQSRWHRRLCTPS